MFHTAARVHMRLTSDTLFFVHLRGEFVDVWLAVPQYSSELTTTLPRIGVHNSVDVDVNMSTSTVEMIFWWPVARRSKV